MASLGVLEVMVYEPWIITIISTGDELVHPSLQRYLEKSEILIPTPSVPRRKLTVLSVKCYGT